MKKLREQELYSLNNGYVTGHPRSGVMPTFIEDVKAEATRSRRLRAEKAGQNLDEALWAHSVPISVFAETKARQMPLIQVLRLMREHGFGSGAFDLTPGGFDLVFYRESLGEDPHEEVLRLHLTEDMEKQRARWHVVKMNATYDELVAACDVLAGCGVEHGVSPEDYPLIF